MAETGDSATEKQQMKERDDDELTHVSELNENSEKPTKQLKHSKEEKEEKRKQFFKEELKRLQRSLQKESSKIKAPPIKEHVPYCFNTLEPYYNTSTASHVIEKTLDNGKLKSSLSEYATRQTAIGLVDPWVNHKMDIELGPKVKFKEPSPFRQVPKKEKKVGDGSTMIPKYPIVNLETPDLATRRLDYSDVAMLRQELREKYSSQGKAKTQMDYKNTKVDFYRMELHKLDDVHPMNRDNLKAAYYAYLQNTPGSKKALNECINAILAEHEMEDKKGQDGEQEKSQVEKSEPAPQSSGETPKEDVKSDANRETDEKPGESSDQ